MKRWGADRGTQRTFSASPRTDAAMARQMSTSRPVHLPWLSAAEKPETPVLTPQVTRPLALMASRVLPASAGALPRMAAAPRARAMQFFVK